MSSHTIVSVCSSDERLVDALAARVALERRLRVALPNVHAHVTLIDEPLPAAIDILQSVGDESRGACVVLCDDADLEGMLALLAAGARGLVPRSAEAADLHRVIDVAASGAIELPAALAGRVLEHLALPADPLKLASAADLASVEDVIAQRRFEMVFQPIADLRSGRITAVEAFARFRTEQGHPPNVWLELADAVGLRVPLEHALVRAACACLSALPADVALAVNLSPAAAMDPGLRDALGAAALNRVIVEITDHSGLDDYEPLIEALADLRAGGLRVAVDDSGQGLSSLQQVGRLAPNFMKLNRSLTRDIHRDPTKHALAVALCSFAVQIGSGVVAEGLETEDELEILRLIGAPLGQGYLLARPQPLADLVLTEPLTLPASTAAASVRPDGPTPRLSGRSRDGLRDAVRATLRFLASHQPAATFVVAHLDYTERRHSVIDARGPLQTELSAGLSTALEASMCFHMIAGRGPRMCPDVADDVVYESLAFARNQGVGAYAGVPLELPDGTRVGSIFAITREANGLGEEDLRLIHASASALAEVLAEHASQVSGGEFMRNLRQLARSDELTGALNAAAFEDVLHGRLLRPGSLKGSYYIGLSIDDLGALRERYGHAVGDLVLKDAAAALSACVHACDPVGRVGDGRFAALVLGATATLRVEHLVNALRGRLADAAARREITVSARAGAVVLDKLSGPEQAWDLAFEAARSVAESDSPATSTSPNPVAVAAGR